jgi:hypothetical protein
MTKEEMEALRKDVDSWNRIDIQEELIHSLEERGLKATLQIIVDALYRFQPDLVWRVSVLYSSSGNLPPDPAEPIEGFGSSLGSQSVQGFSGDRIPGEMPPDPSPAEG